MRIFNGFEEFPPSARRSMSATGSRWRRTVINKFACDLWRTADPQRSETRTGEMPGGKTIAYGLL